MDSIHMCQSRRWKHYTLPILQHHIYSLFVSSNKLELWILSSFGIEIRVAFKYFHKQPLYMFHFRHDMGQHIGTKTCLFNLNLTKLGALVDVLSHIEEIKCRSYQMYFRSFTGHFCDSDICGVFIKSLIHCWGLDQFRVMRYHLSALPTTICNAS